MTPDDPKKTELVSIIVPIYNVENYIDKCVQSLVAQTYKNIEIMLINDGSTDNSLKKCQWWEEQDSRIKVFDKENEGLGETRNYGVRRATGSYIMFVDSDDWVDVTITEKLMYKLLETDADIAVCDRYAYHTHTGEKTLTKCALKDTVQVVEVKKNPNVIFDVSTVAYCKLYKKDLIVDNELWQPDCLYEDIVIPVLMALAEKICYVPEPLYYWVCDRTGSITNSMNFLNDIKYLHVLKEEFTKRNLFETFGKQYEDIVRFRIGWNYEKALTVANKNISHIGSMLKKYKEQNVAYCNENGIDLKLQDNAINSILVIGSYNLMRIASGLFPKYSENRELQQYSFSNLISMMSQERPEIFQSMDIQIDNPYRKKHIIQDIQKKLGHLYKSELSQVDLVLIDFLEDRYPVGKIAGTYITLSDAFLESSLNKQLDYEIVNNDDELFDTLWKDSCDKFIHFLNQNCDNKKVVLVKMKLASNYGNKNVLNSYTEDVFEINMMLEKKYKYFTDNYQVGQVITVEDSELFFTDENHRHGCYPWHLNTNLYHEVTKKIRSEIIG